MLRAARESLGDGTLLVVDDAHCWTSCRPRWCTSWRSAATARLSSPSRPVDRLPTRFRRCGRDDLLTRIDFEPPGHDDARLAAQVEEYVAGLPAAARGVLEYLAVEEPLPMADLIALASRDAVEQAETLGGDRHRRARRACRASALRSTRCAMRLGGPDLRRLRTGWWTAARRGLLACRRPAAGGGAGARQ